MGLWTASQIILGDSTFFVEKREEEGRREEETAAKEVMRGFSALAPVRQAGREFWAIPFAVGCGRSDRLYSY